MFDVLELARETVQLVAPRVPAALAAAYVGVALMCTADAATRGHRAATLGFAGLACAVAVAAAFVLGPPRPHRPLEEDALLLMPVAYVLEAVGLLAAIVGTTHAAIARAPAEEEP